MATKGGENEDVIQRRIRRGSLSLSRGPSNRSMIKDPSESLSAEDIENGWSAHETPEGATYFYNSITKKTTWDEPVALGLRERKSSIEDKKPFFWVKDEVLCYAAASKVNEKSKFDYKTLDGRIITLAGENDVISEIHDVTSINKDTDDMVKQEDIQEASVLHNIRLRCEKDIYFTNIGTILVSVNPFKWLDYLYTPEQFLKYRDRCIGEEVAPHFFEISDNAYRGLKDDMKSQCVIISGESGSGKTEATKKCLQYFADVAGSNLGLENKLLATNPILEAFGNAKTVRNGNSSRFGKWTAVHFDQNGRISGGKIVNYLLEKSRVAIQMPGERNYHIFYQMIKGANESQRAKYCLAKNCSNMKYLIGNKSSNSPSSKEMNVNGIDDKECFMETLEAFQELGFSSEEVDLILKVTSGVLWLGNIEFETPVGMSIDDPCAVKMPQSEQAIANVCELLSLDQKQLLNNVMNRIRVMGGQRIESPLNSVAAADSCSALAREIYAKLFDWLVKRVNETLHNAEASSNGQTLLGTNRLIGVLDIFGFEIFENNSFEQLCINFTNEKLQQHFNNHTFKTEQIVYQTQGIDFKAPEFRDNQDVLGLLEDRPRGLFVLLDEECVLPRGSDDSYFNKIIQFHNDSNKRFVSGPKLKTKLKLAFAVEHYAGLVIYNAKGFMEKNKDDLRDNLNSLVKSSFNEFIRQKLFAEDNDEDGASSGVVSTLATSNSSKKRRRHKTQAGFFRKQLDELMQVLNSAEPHYIRCIKPNSEKCADRFDPFLCLEQLRYSGIFEAIEIRKQGFPFRRSHEQFFKRYRTLIARENFAGWNSNTSMPNYDQLCPKLIDGIAREKRAPVVKECRIGTTMILYRAAQHILLESLREERQIAASKDLLRVARGFLARKHTAVFKSIRQKLLDTMKARQQDQIESVLAEVSAQVKPPFSLYKETKEAKALVERIKEEKDVCNGIEDMRALLSSKKNIAPAEYYQEIETILEKAIELDIANLYPEYEQTLKDFDKRIQGVRELINAKKDLKEASKTSMKSQLVSAIQKAQDLSAEHGSFCDKEIQAAKDMLDRVVKEQPLLDKVLAGLSNGAPRGQVGNLDLSSIDTKSLEKACITLQDKRPDLTPRGLVLCDIAEQIIGLRETMKQRDWDAVEGFISKLDEMQDEELFEKFDVPSFEVDLCRDELGCYTIVSELAESVKHGPVGGKPGELEVESVAIDDLKVNIEDAKTLGCPAKIANDVIKNAELVLGIRQAVPQDDWKSVESYLKKMEANPLPPSDEYAKMFLNSSKSEIKLLQRHLLGKQIESNVMEALSDANCGISGSVGQIVTKKTKIDGLEHCLEFVSSATNGEPIPTKSAKQLVDFVSVVRDIRGAFKNGTSEKLSRESIDKALSNAKTLNVPNASLLELELVRSELAERECIRMLEASVAHGKASGKVGNLDLGKVSVEPLEKAILQTNDIWNQAGMKQGAGSAKGAKLVEAVQELIKLRISLKSENWDMVEDILANSVALVGTGAPDEEVMLIQEELNNRLIIEELGKALDEGKLQGPIGLMKFELIETESLEGNIVDAKELGCKTKEAKNLLETAILILELRKAFKKQRWDIVQTTLEKVPFKKPAKIASDEIKRAEKEFNDRRILHELGHALENGGPVGTLEDLRVDTITFHVLDEALALCQKLRCESKRAQTLYAASKIIRAARAALTEQRYLQLGPLVEDAERQGYLHVDGQDEGVDEQVLGFVEPASAELEIIRGKFRDEKMKQDLSTAISQGRVGGRIGSLDLSSIKLGKLLELVSKYSVEEPRTVTSKQLLVCTRLIVSLRESLLSGPDWDQVEKLVDGLSTERMVADHGFDICTEIVEEVDLVRDEIQHRFITKVLSEGIIHGAVKGSIGALDVRDLSVDELNSAISKVQVLQMKTPEATRLQSTATAMRDVRACILDIQQLEQQDVESKWLGSVQVALDKAHSVGVSDIAKEELKLIQDHVDDVKIIRELCSALGQGSIHGPVGEAKASSCDKERLASALACAHTLVCKTERAKKLEKTAKVVFQLRTTLVEEGWESMGECLEKRLGISIQGGVPPDSFRGLSDEGTEEFQRLIDECRERLARTELERLMDIGGIQGKPGALVAGDTQVFKALKETVEFAERVSSRLTKATKDLTRVAETILEIRDAFKHGGREQDEIDSVATSLASLPTPASLHVNIPAKPNQEMELAMDHINDFRILSLANDSISKSSNIDPSPLATALKTIEGSLGGPKSEKASDAVQAIELLVRLRTSLKQKNFSDLAAVLSEALESAGISQFEDAQAQVYEARSVLMNHDTVKSLGASLDDGMIIDPSNELDLGQIDFARVNGEKLEETIKEARQQVAGDFDPFVSKLLGRCNLVCELRSAFQLVERGNWSRVEAVRLKFENTCKNDEEIGANLETDDGLGSEQTEAVEEQLRKINSEFQLVEHLFQDQMALQLLTETMSEGHLAGSVGNVSTSAVKIEPLEVAIEKASNIKKRSAATDLFLVHARQLIGIRRAQVADDWNTVLSTTMEWKEEYEHAVTDDVKTYALELDLALEEAKRRVIVDDLVDALASDGVEGEPGALKTHHVSVALLNKAIARALEIGVKTDDAQQLLLAAHSVKQIRNGILAGPDEGGGAGHVDCALVREALRVCNDEGLDSLPEVCHREIILVQQELEDQESAKILSSALRNGGTAGDEFGVESLSRAIAQTEEEQCHTIFSQALHKIAFIVRDLRRSILETAWEDAARCIRVLDEIGARVRQGDAPVSTQEKQNQQWRAALILTQRELAEARDQVENAGTVKRLREAMLTGQAPGTFGFLRLDRIDTGKLDDALAHAVDVGLKSEEASILYKTARLLRQLRCATRDHDFVTASVVLSEAQAFASVALGEALDAPKIAAFHRLPVAGAEFEILFHEVENKLVCRALLTALKSGAITGKVGTVTVTESNIQALEKAMAKANDLERATDETWALIHSCKVILKLRQILIHNHKNGGRNSNDIVGAIAVRMWDSAQQIVSEAISTTRPLEPQHVQQDASDVNGIENYDKSNNQMVVVSSSASSEITTSFRRYEKIDKRQFNLMWCHRDARDELSLLLDEIQHREALQLLLSALSVGAAKFLGGFVDVSSVKTGPLEAAINNAKTVPTRTEEITLLQLSATIVLRSREALLDGSWGDLRQILAQSDEIGGVHHAAVDEINLLKREVHLHSVIKSVLLNLQEASQSRNVQALEAALREAETLRLTASPDLHVLARVNKARQLLDRLVVVEDRLQESMKRSDLEGLEQSLHEATRLYSTPEAASSSSSFHQLQQQQQEQYPTPIMLQASHMRDRLKNIFQRADEAIEKLDPNAIRDVLDTAKRENIQLPRANEMRRILAYPPADLERMRLNSAIERNDEETVIQVTMNIKDRFFEQESARERFYHLEYFTKLKSPSEFAANTGLIEQALENSMLKHSKSPIPTSLTRLSTPAATSLAIKLFKALLTYLHGGENSSPNALVLFKEILQVGLAVEELRDEIFLQLMKELTDNPSQSSREKAWFLLHTCLRTFPPSENFENFLELWLRRKSFESRRSSPHGSSAISSQLNAYLSTPTQCLYELHRIVFKGPASSIPVVEERQIALPRTGATNVVGFN